MLHNNAATLGPEVILEDNAIVDMDVDVWDRTLAVNLRGAMLGCKHAIPVMRDQGGGAIVSTTSVSALVGEDTKAAYACSKAALIALTRHVANMHGADGIRINAVAPGLMITPVVIERLTERDFAGVPRRAAAREGDHTGRRRQPRRRSSRRIRPRASRVRST